MKSLEKASGMLNETTDAPYLHEAHSGGVVAESVVAELDGWFWWKWRNTKKNKRVSAESAERHVTSSNEFRFGFLFLIKAKCASLFHYQSNAIVDVSHVNSLKPTGMKANPDVADKVNAVLHMERGPRTPGRHSHWYFVLPIFSGSL